MFSFPWVYSGAPKKRRVRYGSSGFTGEHQGIVGFIRDSVGSLSPGSFAFAWIHSGTPRDFRVHSVSRGFTRTRIPVAGFFRVRVGSLGCV